MRAKADVRSLGEMIYRQHQETQVVPGTARTA
jgi:hypothetical protein